MKLRTIRDLDVRGKTIFVRVDYNVPIKDGVVDDTLRITASFQTIKYLLDQDCKIVLASHLGRPDGKPDPKLSLAPVAAKVSELLGREVHFAGDCLTAEALDTVQALKSGDIILLENLRFHAEEEANDPKFAERLAGFGEAYVDDAFACVHRAHASIVGITEHLPSAAGFLVESEVQHITDAVENPKRPLLAVIGGAKLETKVELLDNLLNKVDAVLIGGEMANTMLAALGTPIGKSKYEPEEKGLAKKVLDDAEGMTKEIMLPTDVIVADGITAAEAGSAKTVDASQVTANDFIVDIGPRSVDTALAKLDGGGTVIWNGPVGVTEVPEFSQGSLRLAKGIIASGADSIIGGGDTADFIDGAGLHDKFTFVSTGGGASLELMSGKTLPGLKVLES